MATNKQLRKVQKWYHATTDVNAEKILEEGYIKPIKGQYVFLADSIEYACQFMSMRGINENIVVFKIKKHQLDTKYYRDNTCDAVFKSIEDNKNLSIAYGQAIDISRCKYSVVNIEDPMEAPRGCSFVKDNGKIGIQIDNMQEFEQEMKDYFNNGGREQIEKDSGLQFKDFDAFESFMKMIGGPTEDFHRKGFDHFTKDLV